MDMELDKGSVITATNYDSLTEYAYNEIRIRIQNGVFPPGTKLVTQKISDDLGISRTPVVAAVNRLIAAGLAESAPNHSTVVMPLTKQKIHDILQVRYMIEEFVIPHAIKNAPFCSATLREMEQVIIESQEIGDDDYDKASRLDGRFHLLYVSLSCNEQLKRLYNDNWGVSVTYYMYKAIDLPLTQMEHFYADHREWLKCLQDRNQKKLEKLVHNHTDGAFDLLDWIFANYPTLNFKKI